MKLEDYVRGKLEEIREELPTDAHLYILNTAPAHLEAEAKKALDAILLNIQILCDIQDDCYSI